MSEADAVIANLRAQIDEVDATLVALLRKRLNLVFAVNFVKHVAGREVLDADRESELLNRAGFAGVEVVRVYSRIIATCRELAAEKAAERKTPVPDPVDGGDPSGPPKRPDGR